MNRNRRGKESRRGSEARISPQVMALKLVTKPTQKMGFEYGSSSVRRQRGLGTAGREKANGVCRSGMQALQEAC